MSRRSLLVLCLCFFLLTSCASSGSASSNQPMSIAQQPGSNLPSPTAEALPGLLQTEQVLLMAQPQASNLYALARELKTHRRETPALSNPGTPLNERAGQEDSFWVQNQDSGAWTRLHARLAIITAHAYIYVQDGQPVNQTALQSSAMTFEQQIYPTEHSTTGSEWMPGIDGDAHLTILNAAG